MVNSTIGVKAIGYRRLEVGIIAVGVGTAIQLKGT